MIIEMIANETGASHDYLNHVIATASHRYRTYEIPKRSGGTRTINHPTPLLKFLQRWIVRNIVLHLPVHSSVTSYKRGDSVLNNARAHVLQNYLLKMDFKDFFPSLNSADIRSVLRNNRSINIINQLSREDEDALLSIVCRFGSLTIGAPSSPTLSNAILFKFDDYVYSLCMELGITYTRYADDLSFSSNRHNGLHDIPAIITDFLSNQPSPRLHINEEKTVFSSRKHKRIVTGITLTSDRKISIGRERKRWLRTACYKFLSGSLTAEETSSLRGYLSFVHAIEPEFIVRLQKKFGEESIDRIQQLPLLSLKSGGIQTS
jgi:hypothetical protein